MRAPYSTRDFFNFAQQDTAEGGIFPVSKYAWSIIKMHIDYSGHAIRFLTAEQTWTAYLEGGRGSADSLSLISVCAGKFPLFFFQYFFQYFSGISTEKFSGKFNGFVCAEIKYLYFFQYFFPLTIFQHVFMQFGRLHRLHDGTTRFYIARRSKKRIDGLRRRSRRCISSV